MNRITSHNSLNRYRQYSYSESFIDYSVFHDSSLNFPITINSDFPFAVQPAQPSSLLPTTTIPTTPPPITFLQSLLLYLPSFQYLYSLLPSIFQHFLMYLLHIGLISLFEIYFFFHVISQYENNALLGLINSYFDSFISSCNSIPLPEHDILSLLFHSFINQTIVFDDASYAFDRRLEWNNSLYTTAWTYFAFILFFNICLLFINFYFRIGIPILKLLLDNCIMIIFLGLYEFLFFQSIILKYQSISSAELTANIVQQLNSCFPPNSSFPLHLS